MYSPRGRLSGRETSTSASFEYGTGAQRKIKDDRVDSRPCGSTTLTDIENAESRWLDQWSRAPDYDLTCARCYRDIRHYHSFFKVKRRTPLDQSLTLEAKLRIAAARNYRFLRNVVAPYARRSTVSLYCDMLHIRRRTLLHRDRDFDLFEKHLGLHVVHA